MRRQRTDGSWTTADEEWDRVWYWPVGTRVSVATVDGPAIGTVSKSNPVSVRVTFVDPRHRAAFGHRLISVKLLTRL